MQGSNLLTRRTPRSRKQSRCRQKGSWKSAASSEPSCASHVAAFRYIPVSARPPTNFIISLSIDAPAAHRVCNVVSLYIHATLCSMFNCFVNVIVGNVTKTVSARVARRLRERAHVQMRKISFGLCFMSNLIRSHITIPIHPSAIAVRVLELEHT